MITASSRARMDAQLACTTPTTGMHHTHNAQTSRHKRRNAQLLRHARFEKSKTMSDNDADDSSRLPISTYMQTQHAMLRTHTHIQSMHSAVEVYGTEIQEHSPQPGKGKTIKSVPAFIYPRCMLATIIPRPSHSTYITGSICRHYEAWLSTEASLLHAGNEYQLSH